MNANPLLAPDLIDRTSAALAQFSGVFTLEYLPFIVIALVPAIVWLYLMWQHQSENKFLTFLTFCAGMLSVVPVWIFRNEIAHVRGWFESTALHAVVAMALTSLWVGIYEETAKHWVVKVTDQNFFDDIDDAIQFSIIAALGFAFVENILYFYNAWHGTGIVGGDFLKFFFFRSLLSVGLHVIASGTYGYFYGIAHFAGPVLQDELRLGTRFPLIGWLHRVLSFKSETVFHEEKIIEGLVLAAVIHGVFDFLMGLGDYANQQGATWAMSLLIVANVPLIVGGYFWLTYLLDKKEDHKRYGKLSEERTSGSIEPTENA